MSKNIVLIGFMGTGKTTIGRLTASKLSCNFVDSDEEIEKQSSMGIRDMFLQHGENYFRNLEKKTIYELSKSDSTVISTGGGVVLDSENVENLKRNGILVLLKASPEIILSNISDSQDRPVLREYSIEEINKILKQREKYYRCRDFEIIVDGLTTNEAADRVIAMLKEKNVL